MGKKHSSDWIGKKAVKLVTDDYATKGITLVKSRTEGADLEYAEDGHKHLLEVKGTTSSGVALSKLKVSSQDSCDLLENGQAELIRVCGIGTKTQRFRTLVYGTDYVLKREDRWKAIRPSRVPVSPAVTS